MSILREIVRDRRRRVESDKARGLDPTEPPAPRVEGRAERFLRRIDSSGIAASADGARPATRHAIIAEIKRRSPSRGELRSNLDPPSLALAYQRAGAGAVSVLTEPDRFGGSFEDLAAVSRVVSIPVLCKDFVIDPFQIRQARAPGADLVLLMVS